MKEDVCQSMYMDEEFLENDNDLQQLDYFYGDEDGQTKSN